MDFSNYLAQALVNGTLRGIGYTAPGTVYVALYTTNPGAGDTGVEVSGGSYARQPATFTVPAGNGVTQNASNIVFPQASAGWGTIVAIGIRDALSGGNLLYFGPLTSPRIVNNGDIFEILAGQLQATLQ